MDKIPKPKYGKTGFASAPSNIALIKYWGKDYNTFPYNPLNPNLSLTLSNLRSYTSVTFKKNPHPNLKKDCKTSILLQKICPWNDSHFTYESTNTFPDSCGIASSASGICALVCAISDCLNLTHHMNTIDHHNWLSHWCRIGSGSSVRSLFPNLVSWNQDKVSQFIKFKYINHVVVVFDPNPKKITSTQGHRISESSPLFDIRTVDSHDTYDKLKQAIIYNEWNDIIKLVEHDYLFMHAVMMTSKPPIHYLNQTCIDFISEFMKWRNKYNVKAFITIDAGSNPHIIFDVNEKQNLNSFLQSKAFVQLIWNNNFDTGPIYGKHEIIYPEINYKNIIFSLSGKRYSGKTFLSNHIKEKYPNIKLCSISESIKYEYSQMHNLDFQKLLHDRNYKEKYRPSMIKFMEGKLSSDPFFWIRKLIEKNLDPIKQNILCVTDVRRPKDIEYLQKFGKHYLIRIKASDSFRQKNGWIKSIVDQSTSETALDNHIPDVIWHNNDEPVTTILQKINHLIPSTGFGKLILFGEHFVVHNLPSIVVAIPNTTSCHCIPNDKKKIEIFDNRPALFGYKQKKHNEIIQSTNLLFNLCEIKKPSYDIYFNGDLCCTSGIGSSAANCVALARELNKINNFIYNDDEINQLAYQGESISHGTPSGIDNTASTYGGLLYYQKNPRIIEKIKIKTDLFLLYVSTTITASTTKVLNDVMKLKKNNSTLFNHLTNSYKNIVHQAKNSLIIGDLKKLGELMFQNHHLLVQLKVSSKELDDIVDIAKCKNAYGAKMTGTGRGGLAIILAQNEENQTDIYNHLLYKNYEVWKANILV